MRTRFLNTDYITSSSSSSIETLTFLNLPVPPPPPSCNFKQEEHLLRFDPISNLSPSIDRPPIDSALSKFIADVIPQFIEFKYSPAHESCRFSSPSSSEIGAYEKEEERDAGFGSEAFEVIQFETPELDAFLENSCFCEDRMEILSEVPEIEHDSTELRPGLQMQYPEQVQESIYSVEDITLDFDMDEKACALEDDGSVEKDARFQHNVFPLLEVEETSLVTLRNPSMEYGLFSFLGNIDRQWIQEDKLLPIDGVELLGSTQFDILEFLLNHCLSELRLQPELESLDTFQGIDMIFMVETLQTQEDSADCLLPMNPAVFEEFKFLDIGTSQHYKVFFELQIADQPEPFDLMFREDKNFKSFDELIVSCELTLADDTFKSLPIPIITDHDKVRSVYAIMDEKLSELKPQPLSTSDRIYLDWHFLEEDKCNCKILFSFQNMLEELDSYSINFDWESFDDGKLVIDMILSDDALSGPQKEEREELLNVTSETSKRPLVEVASSNSLGGSKYPKLRHGEQSVEENAGKSSLLFKSMSQFNDLDYFLNPGKATAREKSISAVKAPDNSVSFPKEGESCLVLGPDENMNSTELEELLSFVPVEDKYNVRSSEAAHKVESCCMHIPVPCAPNATKSGQSHGGTVSLPDIVVIVNTQNFDKEMIVSRRSTYQRILAMEKEGAQVVERDLDMPVDVIISSSICLVWYDCENIRKKATSVDEASSCLPLCIENIATDVLTLLSLTFSGCILVFEGEISFLTTVMESSDGLYAAAASLGIDLQLFCSYSSEMTNEVIVSSILCATKLSRGIYPSMPESENLAESFLTKFPSINPLTALAILSSGGMLIEFLEWSHERRILAVEQYHVPVESVALFSALCKYGEREDSKSIMTDCSSSASSCPDSDKCHFLIDPGRKRQKIITSPKKMDTHVNDIWEFEPLNQHTGGKAGPGVFKQDDGWRPTDPEILEELKQPSSFTKQHDGWITDPDMLDELKQPNSSFKDLFGQKHISGITQVMAFPAAMKPFDSGNSKYPLIFDEMKHLSLPRNDKFLAQNRVSETNIKNELNLEWRKSKSENLQEDFIGEIIDFNDNPLSLGKDVASISKKTSFSPWMPEMEPDSTKKSRAARRLSFNMNSHPTFPTADEINSSSDLWTSPQDNRQSLPDNYGYPHIKFNHDKVPVQPQRNLLEEVLMQRAAGNAKGFPFKEELSQCGGTPLSKAIRSSQPQPGSPWTIEFLNRIREKSRLRQQSLPRDASTPDFRFSRSISKVTKTRSPSIFEFFKYQRGSSSGKVPEQKKQKRTVQLSNPTQKERTSASLIPTWTPVDKRSKQTLSFEMDDSGSQTRLVWSDGGAHRLSKKFRKN